MPIAGAELRVVSVCFHRLKGACLLFWSMDSPRSKSLVGPKSAGIRCTITLERSTEPFTCTLGRNCFRPFCIGKEVDGSCDPTEDPKSDSDPRPMREKRRDLLDSAAPC